MLHKREHTKVQEQSVDLSQYLVNDTVQTDDNCQDGTSYNPEDDFSQTHQLGESIILEDNDILFRYITFVPPFPIVRLNDNKKVRCSMDQEGASYLTSDSSFGVPIILNSGALDSFANASIADPVDDHLDENIRALQNDIERNLDDSDTPQIDEAPKDDIPCESSEQDNKSDQTQSLKVRVDELGKHE